ncbi:MAG: glutamate--tRNA ligase [Candidatus Aenigmatarchaeota archaeon]
MIKTRFAPSPTGYLHIGGARTALFNWLFSRKNKGVFILRIEDTDIQRSTEEATKAILEDLEWLGLKWDDGPYFQSKRMRIYQEHAERLLDEGKAYFCYCTPEELEERRKKLLMEGKKPKYDRRCLGIKPPPGRKAAIRFLIPDEGETEVNDIIKGNIHFRNDELDDLIIVRSDGIPTYNFCAVVDDALMGITHVIRGDDHLNNTPKQILIYKALGYSIPKFAHVPLILGLDRTRLSKRHGATSVSAYREMGYLPEALVNYLARLGWSYGDQEFFTVDELIEKFTLENVGKSQAIFNPEKLLWLNHEHMKRKDSQSLSQLLIPFLEKRGINCTDREKIVKAVNTLKARAKTLYELSEFSEFYFVSDVHFDKDASEQYLKPETLPYLLLIKEEIAKSEHLDPKAIESRIRQLAKERSIKLVEIAQPIRVALTGGTVSPPIFDVMDVLGREESIRRIDRAVDWIRSKMKG